MRYTEVFAANTARRYHTPGASFFYLESVPGGFVTVNFYRANQKLPEEVIAPRGGWWVSFGEWTGSSPSFDEVELVSSVAQTVVFHVSRAGIGFSGVEVLQFATTAAQPQGDDKTVSDGKAGMEISVLAALAGNINRHQIFNPGGSGKTVYLDRFVFAVPGATQAFIIAVTGGALPNLVSACANKLLGAAALTAEVREGQQAAPSAAFIGGGACPAGGEVVRDFKPAIRMDPGQGISIDSTVVNAATRCQFEVREY
jgi:hypothetical protein